LRTGIIDENLYFKKLERYLSRYMITNKLWPVAAISLVKASHDKPKNWLQIYGGGATLALMLDIEIRDLTNGIKGLDDVMLLLQQRHGLTGIKYKVKDIEQAVSDISGHDFENYFKRYVHGSKDYLPLKSTLAKAGLALDQFSDEFYISHLKSTTDKQLQIWRGIIKE